MKESERRGEPVEDRGSGTPAARPPEPAAGSDRLKKGM
jgi:hypothetical protein